MFIPLLDAIDIQGKDITADALLTQRKLAAYIVGRQAHYHFTVKANQPTLQADIALLFQNRQAPDQVIVSPPDHGRIETRRIWCSTALNSYAHFPHVGQVFLIEREVIHKKTQKQTLETALGITSRPPEQAGPKRLLESIAATGRSRTAATMSSTGTSTKTGAAFAPAMVPRTSLAFVASPSVSCTTSRTGKPASRKKWPT
jgi:hypothetical protein